MAFAMHGRVLTFMFMKTHVFINGEWVDMVDIFKFLGFYRKGQHRLFSLRRIRSLNMDTKLLWVFYSSLLCNGPSMLLCVGEAASGSMIQGLLLSICNQIRLRTQSVHCSREKTLIIHMSNCL